MLAGAGGFGLFTWGYDRGEKFALVGIDAAENQAFEKGKSEVEAALRSQFATELVLAKEEANKFGRDEGYKLGLATANSSYASAEYQTKFFAQLLAIFQSESLKGAFPSDVVKSLQNSVGAASDGNFELANNLLPDSAKIVGVDNCVNSNVPFMLKLNEVIDHCESGSEIAFVGFSTKNTGDPALIVIDGDRESLDVGDTEIFGPGYDCVLTYLRRETLVPSDLPVIRLKCKS